MTGITKGAFNPANYADWNYGDTGLTAQTFVVQPMFWGQEWLSVTQGPSPEAVVSAITKIISGPYMSGLAQYGIHRGEISSQYLMDTRSGLPNGFGTYVGDESPVYDQVRHWHDTGFAGVTNTSALELLTGEATPDPAASQGIAGVVVLAIFSPPGVFPLVDPASKLPAYGGFNGAISVSADSYFWPAHWRGFAAPVAGGQVSPVVHFLWVGNRGDLDSHLTVLFSHELVELLSDPDGTLSPGKRAGVEKTSPSRLVGAQIADDETWTTDRVLGINVVAYWREDVRTPAIPGAARRCGCVLHGSYGWTYGNFELLVGEDGGLRHYFRDNDNGGWHSDAPALPLGKGLSPLSTNLVEYLPTPISSGRADDPQVAFSPPGELVGIALLGSTQGARVVITQRSGGWSAPTQLSSGGEPIPATGKPALIVSRYGADVRWDNPLLVAVPQGNVVALYQVLNVADGSCQHLSSLAPLAAPVMSVQLLQANYGPVGSRSDGTPFPDSAGNLEIVARCGVDRAGIPPLTSIPGLPSGDDETVFEGFSDLWMTYVEDATNPTAPWVRFEPPPGPANVLFVPTGDPAFFQSTYGPIGNFELLVPSFDRVWHFARINDLHEFNWIYKGIVAATGSVLSVAAFQSSYTTPDEIENHFEALMLVQPAHASSEIYFTWFDFGGGWRTPHPVYVDGSPLKNVQAM